MPRRYSPAQQVMHWATVVMMFAILPIAWVMMSLKEDTPPFYFWLNIHKGIGLLILGLTLFRIAWSRIDPPPALPRSVGRWNRRTAHLAYAGLLFLMIAMPATGYVWTTGHGYDVMPFGWFAMPRLFFKNRVLGDAAAAFHRTAQWLVYGLIGLHLTGVSFHLIWKRDGLLARMLPAQSLSLEDEFPGVGGAS